MTTVCGSELSTAVDREICARPTSLASSGLVLLFNVAASIPFRLSVETWSCINALHQLSHLAVKRMPNHLKGE